MTDLEKLMRLIDEAADITPVSHGGQISYYLDSEKIADHLIAHGVTVREPQKPMDLVDAIEADDPVWLEQVFAFMEMEVIKIYPTDYLDRRFYKDGTLIGKRINKINILLQKDDYGKGWRCWAEKPTEEERKAAEWLGPLPEPPKEEEK